MLYSLQSEPAPKDNWNVVWVFCVMCGIAQMLPWNAFITASDYYHYEFGNFPIMFALPIANNWGGIISYFVLAKWGNQMNTKAKLYSGYFIVFAMLVAIPVINLTGLDSIVRVWLTLVACFICGICSSILVSTIFSVVSLLPAQYTTAVMTGQGIAGVFIGLMKICMNFWWFPDINSSTSQVTGLIYFAISAIVVLVCTCCNSIMMNLRFYNYYMDLSFVPTFEATNLGESKDLMETEQPSFRYIMKKIWVDSLSVFLIFFVTLSLFPGFTLLIPNHDKNIPSENFGVIIVAIFQLCDFVGRFLPKFFQFPSSKFYWICVLIRPFVFYPIIMLSIYTTYLPYNAITYVTLIIFGISNGYFSTLGMMYGPGRVVGGSEVAYAGNLMGLSLQLGVFLGVHAAMIFLFAAEGSAVIGI